MAIRIIPYSIYDVPAMEGWLEKMSRKGRHFRKFTGAPWAEFWEGEPRDYRYRLEPCRRKEAAPDSDTIAAYHQAGWDYVATRRDKTFHIWRSQKNTKAQELHTDPVVQSYGYDWLEKRVKRNAVINLLVITAEALFIILWLCANANVGVIISRDSNFVQQLFWVAALAIFFTYQEVSNLTFMRRLLRSLRAGVPLARGRRAFPAQKLAWYGYFGAFAVYLVLIWFRPGTVELSWKGDPRDYPEPLPFVSIEQLGREEQAEWAVYWETSYLMESIEIVEGDYVSYIETEGPWAGWSTGYRPGRTWLFRLRLGFMADDLLAGMVEYQKENRLLVEELTDGRFDEAWYAVDEDEQVLLLLRDDYVMRYIARVPEDLREHLDLFAEAMDWEYSLPEKTGD